MLALVDDQGEQHTLQSQTLTRWADGSAKWILLDWLADASKVYRVGLPESPIEPQHCCGLSCKGHSDDRGAVIDTGIARFEVNVGNNFPFNAVWTNGNPAIDPDASGLILRDDNGLIYTPSVERISIETMGPIRASVRIEGVLRANNDTALLGLNMTLHFFANSATARAHLTLTNQRKAGHPSGHWGLGNKGSVYLEDAAFILALPRHHAATKIDYSLAAGTPFFTARPPFELYQDSSGGENWDHENHVNRFGEVPNQFRGFRLRTSESHSEGNQATPALRLSTPGGCISVAMQHFWQNFPKALEATEQQVILRLFPRQYQDVHEIQGGEQKTHVFHLSVGRREGAAESLLDWCRAPLIPHAEPDWYSRTKAVLYLVPESEDPHKKFVALVAQGLTGAECLEVKREQIDEYGWRHFGDLYADHEAVFSCGPRRLISHYNNQYDAVHGFAIHFMRSGERRWFQYMSELAQHVVDIDIYHTAEDKWAYNHGSFWHTDHYVDAGLSNHRSYPVTPRTVGGGPAPGHLYASGLLMHYLLTGNQQSRDTVVALGQYVIDADDGSKTIFRYIDRGDTGHVSESGYDAYHGPGRSPANAIGALLDAHEANGGQKFLDKVEAIIRRCIHPEDDLATRDLLDTENRWYYTIFLQSLGKYLIHKARLGQIDFMYAYARSALLHYAQWAAEHEYPYLERPERLEFPDGTWVAQDLRKSVVFDIASSLSVGEKREHFKRKAEQFFGHVFATIEQLPTRTLCRPWIIVLTNGYVRAFFRTHQTVELPKPNAKFQAFGQPACFVSQKRRVKRRLGITVAACVVAAVMSSLL